MAKVGSQMSVKSSVSSASSKPSSAESGAGSSDAPDDGNMARGAWGGKVEFILTCIGYAVGLGNVWRFPYLVFKNGGGAFLIPFAIMMFLIGIPLFFMELCFGQFATLGPIAIWRISPLMKGIGFSMVFTNLMIALYYNVIISWCLYYLFASMTDKLPWETCNNPWNTPRCLPTDQYKALNGSDWNGYNITDLKSPSDEYYYRQVLKMTPVDEGGIGESGTIVWQLALCLLLCWMLVFFVLVKGISSLGKVVYFSSTFPYLLLTIMLIRGVTLEGAGTGIEFYLIPKWEKLGDPQVWSDAATQIFYAFSTCTGGLIAMASYNEFHNNTLRDSLIVPITNFLTSFYAGFVIFSVLGYMSVTKGVPIEEVAQGGPGLVFVVYPEGLSTMPVAPLWSILFFIMMMMLGLSSMFSMAETFFSGFMDEFPGVLRKTYYHTVAFRAVGCVCFYLISLPMISNAGYYVFTLWDSYTGNFPLLIIGIAEILTIIYIYGYHNFADDIQMMIGKKPKVIMIIFRIAWSLVSPVVLIAMVVFVAVKYAPPTMFSGMDFYEFPSWAEGIGWLIVSLCVVFIPLLVIIQICIASKGQRFTFRHLFQILKDLAKPTPEWGPFLKSNRTGRYAKQTAVMMVAKSDGTDQFDINGGIESREVGKDNKAFEAEDTLNNNYENGSIKKEELAKDDEITHNERL